MTTPRFLAAAAGPDAWLSVIAGSLVALAAAWIMGKLARIFPRENIITYAPRLVGRWPGLLVGLFYAAFWVVTAAKETRLLGELVETYMLERTPVEVVGFAMLLACGYLARNGLEPVARVSQILMPVILIPLVILLLLAWKQADMSNFKPFMEKGLWPVAKGAGVALARFDGLETMLMLIPALSFTPRVPKSAISAVFITLIIQLLSVATLTVTVGPTQAGRFLFPSLTIIQGLRLPSLFFERVTNIVVALWLAAAYAAMATILYVTALAIARLFGLKETRYFILPLTVPIFLISLAPPNVAVFEAASRVFFVVTIFAILLIPLGLYVVGRLRGFRPRAGHDGLDAQKGR